jgi:PAS domain S-box-containing protein
VEPAGIPTTVGAPPGVQDALSASRMVVDSLPAAGVLVVDKDLMTVHAEGSLFARIGIDPRDLAGTPVAAGMGPDRWAELGPRYRAALAGEEQSLDYWEHGLAYWVQINPVRDEQETVTSVVAVIQEITERARVTEALARSEARLGEAEQMVGVGSFELELATSAVTYSEGFRRLLGVSPEDELDLPAYMELVHPDDRDRLAKVIADTVEAGGSASCEYRVIRPDGAVRTLLLRGEIIPDDDGRSVLMRGAALDVTDEREAEHERLEAVSLFQRGFSDSPIGMVMVDPLDGHFMEVNDAMCHLVARSREELLTLAVEDVTHPDDRAGVLEARRTLIDGPEVIHQAERRYQRPDGSPVWVSVHITPVHRSDGSTRASFAQIIDITERKEREARHALQVSDMVWLGRVRDALDDDRLVLYGQPIVDLASGETVQQELLLRMVAEDGSIVSPGEFLPIAERYGLISEIDRWVIHQATAIAATGVRAQFNLSGVSIGDQDVLDLMERLIESTGADASLLVVEVTETAVMDHLDSGRAFIERLTALGCGVALDDFGTGHSGLTYLKHLPAQNLKIDIGYVQDAARSEAGERMVRGIVGLASEFNLTTTAEGVEDEETHVLVRELGVDRAQGYLFGRPQPLA